MKFLEKIINFSSLLRDNGLPVSIRSTKTAVKTIKLVGDDAILQDALASVYLKEQKHRVVFDRLFNEFFNDDGGINEEKNNDKPTDSSKSALNSSIAKNNNSYKVTFQESSESDTKVREINSENFNYHPPLDNCPEDFNESELMYRDINSLDSMKPELFDICQKLGRKIALVRSRRLRRAMIMRPDVRRTIRKNLQNGGVPIDLVRSQPRIKKNHHFFLNDVSGSCDWISNWFFSLVYAAQNSFRRVRVFDFDHKIVETTSAMEEPNLIDAFTKVRDIRQKNLMIHGVSNMFLAFQDFLNRVQLNQKTTLIILTDCRDWSGPKVDGVPQSSEILRVIARRCHKVMILNPEARKKWDVVDSCVSEYQDAGAKIYEVRNLNQLAELVTSI